MNELTITPGFYRHWKGQIYYVIEAHIGRNTTPFVVYSACHGDNSLYTRPVSEWFDVMGQKENGKPLYRFEKIKYEVTEVRHGEWGETQIIGYDGIHPVYAKPCSECGYMTGLYKPNYCPNCGAKMDGGTEDA